MYSQQSGFKYCFREVKDGQVRPSLPVSCHHLSNQEIRPEPQPFSLVVIIFDVISLLMETEGPDCGGPDTSSRWFSVEAAAVNLFVFVLRENEERGTSWVRGVDYSPEPEPRNLI